MEMLLCYSMPFLASSKLEKICVPGMGCMNLALFLRDQNFMVSTVSSQDVIHAGSKLVPAIFKVMNDTASSTFCMSLIHNVQALG